MNANFEECKKKILLMLEFIKDEYENIIVEYSDEKIIKKSIPLCVSSKANEKDKGRIENLLDLMFTPILKQMSEMIDDGIVEWSEVSGEINLEEIANNKEKVVDLFYKGCDRLYIYKQIRYNLFFDFIMQMYLFFEKEIIKFVQNEYVDAPQLKNIYSVIKFIRKKFVCEFDSDTMKYIDLYRDVINVYKHGSGESFDKIVKFNSHILNYTEDCQDMFFVFNLNKLSLEELYYTISNFLDDFYNKIYSF